nr:transglutaminase-like domain-containing protein [Lachnospiraceae bacterium]
MISLIYDLTYTLPLSLILIILLRPYPETLPFFPAICLSGIIAETLIALVCHMKLKRALITFGAFITVLTGTLLSLKTDGRKEFFGDYGYLFVTALLCLAVFLCQKLISVHLFPKILLSLSGILYLLASLFFNFSNSRTLTALILFYAVMTLIETTEYFWKKEGMTGIREYTVYILPFPLIILIFLLLFTPPEKPYDWGFVKSSVTFIRTKLELLLQSLDSSTGWDDSTAEMGFSENSSFLGGLNTTPTDSIKVITDKTSNGRLYLYGKTFDSFNGREWKKTDESDEFYQIYDLLETTGALLKYDPERSRDHIRSAVMSVRYTGIRTSRLFLPAKALPDKNALQLSSTGGDVRFSKNRLSSYRTLFYMINRRYEGFNSFLDSDVRCEAGDLKAAGEYLLSDSFTLPSADEFASYHEHIDAYYNTPVILSEKCRVLLDELLEGAVTDNEKLMRIEKLLSSLRYNAKTEPLPSHVQTPADFIDHILFEKKEGYCTHFATAFVLLARYENIPARYLQGYSTIASPVETDVKSNASHAWPEAYLSGKGWISYEPTPGYKNNGG